ncbi:MAG TPA: DNA polymerase III subunit alpha [Candidatus Acidoferrales bacterium]|jgi:DNA polymerase-3 subunit alpha|nr:DNA polymerase III subunit alpha [Candidatus Acidoferrales bacterium]
MTVSMPSDPRFVHLHLHTDYSLLDGACEIKQLAELAARQGMPAVAVTDHGNLFAAQNFYHEATSRNVKPIIGCEVYVAKGSRHDRGAEAGPRNSNGGRGNGSPGMNSSRDNAAEPGMRSTNHLVLLCENAEGYQNLIKLVSAGFLEGFYYKPRIDHDLLAKHSRGLIALSACLSGEVNEALVERGYDKAREAAYRLRDIFGKGNFFLEVQDQGLDIEKKINPDIVRLSKESGIPLVATNDCHYLTQADARAQEVLLCIQTGKTMSDPHRMKFATDQFYFKTAREMAKIFSEVPEALERTWTIAERCNVRIEQVLSPFPEFRVPDGETADSYFEKVAREGLAGRMQYLEAMAKAGNLRHNFSEYESRLTNEIQMIQRMKFAGYFLIVWDFIHYARTQGVPVGPGRGSAAGSLVSYALRITDVDPLQYNLVFERFLNPERVTLPDIDIDFCMRRRGEVIEYVTQKYGRDNVAQIITFGTMAAKAAIKDVGRALDMPYGEVDRLAKQIPLTLNIKLKDALEQTPQLRQAIESDEKVAELFEIAKRLEGLSRHASTHAAGVVISPVPLTDILPLYKTSRDEITTQYDMKALERLGLLKMDFLGLTTLTVLDDATKLIAQNRGQTIELDRLPLDDAPTYKLFGRGETTAIFQFESHGMRDILRRCQPSRIEDLTALNALYRPGPMGMIDEFIDRKQGKKKITYDLPELKELLEETYGVITYQEHVIQAAKILAGFTLGEADILRRAMGKKKRDEMAKQREKFMNGCLKNKIPAKKAERIFDLMEEFSGYGFPKSHACTYAMLAYQTAYLKTHFPVEFVSALLTSETGNTDKIVKYLNEARGMGITVLPPDVNSSDLYFTPVGEAIRFGLAAIKNVGEGTARAILESRARLGGFKTIFDFCDDVDPRVLNKRALESLIRSGAMDTLGAREQLLATMDDAITSAQKMGHHRSVGQSGLFGGSVPAPGFQRELREADPWAEHDRLAGEYATLGFYVSGHPLSKYADRLRELRAVDLGTMEGRRAGEEIAVAGIVVAIRQMRSRRGARWAILSLQDETGMVEVLVFPESFAKLEAVLKSGAMLFIRGRVNVEDAGTRLAASDAKLIEDVAEPPVALIRLRLGRESVNDELLDSLNEILAERPGVCAVEFELFSTDGDSVHMQSGKHVRADRELIDELRELCGAESVEVVREGARAAGAAN